MRPKSHLRARRSQSAQTKKRQLLRMASPHRADERVVGIGAVVERLADLDKLAQHVSAGLALQRLQRRAWLEQVRRDWHRRGRR